VEKKRKIRKDMSNEWRIYLFYDRILLTNNCGSRIELDVPFPGSMVAVTLNEHTFQFGIHPINYPGPPFTGTQSEPSSSDPSMSPNVGEGGPENPINI